MKKLNKHTLFLYVFCLPITLFSQTKEELKKQKIEIEKEISYTDELLNQTRKNKTKSLNYLNVLESQIKSKEQLLIAMDTEIKLLNKQIKKTKISIEKTEQAIANESIRLQKLKKEYEKMIYAEFKQKGKRNSLMFIVSASNFNQAYKRILYLKQYATFRKNQTSKIIKTQEELINQKERLSQQEDRLTEESSTKNRLVKEKKEEIKSIKSNKKEKENLVKKLSKSERVFKKEKRDKEKQAKKLEDKIRKIIEEEIARSKIKSHELTPESLALSSEFTKNKGKLPWPLERGVIIGRYGNQNHPILPGIKIQNNGIDIATEKNSDVRVVFDGIVSRIFFIKGEGKAVLINHGEYFSVYSGLQEVIVKQGEKLLSKEKIGVVLTREEENKTELHFEIWQGYEKNDPSKWLYNAY